jgi:hypothetical protein
MMANKNWKKILSFMKVMIKRLKFITIFYIIGGIN